MIFDQKLIDDSLDRLYSVVVIERYGENSSDMHYDEIDSRLTYEDACKLAEKQATELRNECIDYSQIGHSLVVVMAPLHAYHYPKVKEDKKFTGEIYDMVLPTKK